MLPLVHLTPELTPYLIAGDVGGVGPLRANEQRVVERVRVKSAGHVQPGGPLVAAGQALDASGQLGMQLGELVLAAFAGCSFGLG